MIPYLDLKSQYTAIKGEIRTAIDRVLESNQYVLGKEVADFEAAFARFCGTNSSVGVNSGTSALHMALVAAGIGPEDEVITVPFTFVATVASILYTGARPVLCDIYPVTYTLDPSQIEKLISPKTKAIIPVHLYGQCADMDPILKIASEHNLVVIEDAAQAHGAAYKGRRTGTMGDMACFSFYPGKNLGAYGEGGAVVTNHARYDKTLRMLRDWGQEKKGHHEIPGFNCRMSAFQGAVLGVKLNYLEEWTEARRAKAVRYRDLLEGSGIASPVELPHNRHVYHVYGIRCRERDGLKETLGKAGIGCGVHYPIPVHLQKGYASLGYGKGDFPVSESLAQEILSLPIYPELSEQNLSEVAGVLRGN